MIITVSAACSQKQTAPSQVFDYAHVLQVGNKTILVEIADTKQKQEAGLSGRPRLQNNQGMLFDFKNSTAPAFWMIGMKFNLDFIWISQNKITGITAGVPAPKAGEKLPLYYPPAPSSEVLEVNAGWAKENNIQIGDGVTLK